MTRKYEVIFLNGWRGGLNLSDSVQQVAQDETPDCLNVTFDDRGGFTTRRGFVETAYNAGVTDPLLLEAVGNRVMTLNRANGSLWFYNGATWTNSGFTLTDDVTQRPVAEQWENNVYFANCYASGILQIKKLSPAGVFTTLTNTFNNDYAQPLNAGVPKARLMANHAGHLWCADTVEAGTRYPSRVRFSHVGRPEDWSEFDYFDLDPQNDRDSIRALFPFYNELLVFKESGVWAIGGWDRDSFYQRKLAPSAGACVPTAVTSSAAICYWISNEGNVFAYNGERAIPIGDQIKRLWTDGEVACSDISIAVWSRGRLYCSLNTTSNQNGMYMYDPSIGRNGAWTRFNFKPSSMLYWRQSGGSDELLFTLDSTFNSDEFVSNIGDDLEPIVDANKRIYNFGQENQLQDLIDGEVYPIPGYLKTNWMTGGETATRKRWRRPRITAGAKELSQLQMEVYRNYNSITPAKVARFNIGSPIGTELEWDVSDWDEAEWGGEENEYSFLRVASLGSAYSIQLSIRSLNNASLWWVDSIALPYRRKGIK